MPVCSSCGRNSFSFVKFACPNPACSNNTEITRCSSCRENENKYKCKNCNFIGP